MEDNTLNKYWDSIKSENYNKSVQEIESWFRKESFNGIKKASTLKAEFFQTLVENKVKYTVILASLLIIFFTGKIPINQSKTIGKVVSWSVDKNSPDAVTKIDNFKWLDKSKLTVADSVINNREVLIYKMLLPAEYNNVQLTSIRNDLNNVNDISGFNLVALHEPVQRPVYAAALYSLFNVDVSAIPAERDRIVNDVSRQLEQAGIQNVVDLDFDNYPGFGDFVARMDNDEMRVQIHDEIVRNTNISRSVDNIKKSLAEHNFTVNTDSIIKNIVVKFDNNILKTISCDNSLNLVNPVIDAIVVKFDGQRNKKFITGMKNFKDSLKNKMKKNIIVNIDIPDEDEIMESINSMDYSSLKNLNIKIMNEAELEKLENLKENVRDQVNDQIEEQLDNLQFNINSELENIPYYQSIPDSIKENLRNLKIKIKHQKHQNLEKNQIITEPPEAPDAPEAPEATPDEEE